MDGGTDEKGGVSRAALSAYSKTSFYGYAHASLHLRTVNLGTWHCGRHHAS